MDKGSTEFPVDAAARRLVKLGFASCFSIAFTGLAMWFFLPDRANWLIRGAGIGALVLAVFLLLVLASPSLHEKLNKLEKQEHPAAAALEIFMSEEESSREPKQADYRLKIDVSEQGKEHLRRLVELGLWGDSVETVAKALVEQSLAAKLESGLLRTSYPK